MIRRYVAMKRTSSTEWFVLDRDTNTEVDTNARSQYEARRAARTLNTDQLIAEAHERARQVS